MHLPRPVGALLLSIGRRIDTRNRERMWGAIALCWIGILVASILAGTFITSAFVRTFLAEFIASLFVAAIVFMTADAIFGFSKHQMESLAKPLRTSPRSI